ncbi:MAG TPA: PAS domain-containing protein, partial [Bacillota bacterium]|nr:PAS domain-containing protein [Bacillota bacterium]
MEFYKMHGLGNDFVFTMSGAGGLERLQGMAKKVCDRNFGVGADGLIVLDGQSFVRYANPAAAALLRLAGPSPAGRRMSELLDSAPLADAVRDVTSRPPGPATVVEHQ